MPEITPRYNLKQLPIPKNCSNRVAYELIVKVVEAGDPVLRRKRKYIANEKWHLGPCRRQRWQFCRFRFHVKQDVKLFRLRSEPLR